MVHGQLLNFDSGAGAPVPTSPPQISEASDSKNYEFDPLTPDLASPRMPDLMSDTKLEVEAGGAFLVDLEDGVNNIHEASTASVTPQSPPAAGSQDPFDALQQMTSPDKPNQSMNPFEHDLCASHTAGDSTDPFAALSSQNVSSNNPFLQSTYQTETVSQVSTGPSPFDDFQLMKPITEEKPAEVPAAALTDSL